MTKLLIADRDYNERIGIQWLVSSYSLPFDKVLLCDGIDDVIKQMENELPDVLFIELDMIPKEHWRAFCNCIHHYGQQVIATSAESTFDRAMQALEAQAVNLLVKPHSPEAIKRGLQQCLQKNSKIHVPSAQEVSSEISYPYLFSEHEAKAFPYPLFLLKTENRETLVQLQLYLQEFKFQISPVIFPLSDMIVCVFPEDLSIITSEANRLLREWDEREVDPLAIVIHVSRSEEHTLHKRYIQAKQVLEKTFYIGYRQVIKYEENWEWIIIDPFLSPAEQRDWIEMLHSEHKVEIKEWLYQEFLQIKEPYPDPGLIRTRLTSILAQIRRFMKTFKLDLAIYENTYHKVFEIILYSPILYRIVQELLLFIYTILEGISEKKLLSKADVVERGRLYIESHYRDKNLSLHKVAKFVNRNPSYLSHLIGKSQGLSFSHLLTETRIREAKRLLLESDFTIQHISDETGFRNANYFSKIFKEYTGVSPSKFRR